MKVSAQYAQEHLDDLLAAAGSGKEVEIARPDQSAFRRVPHISILRCGYSRKARTVLFQETD